MARLDGTTVRALPADVAVPGYDRAAVRPGIVHLGVGGFHRSHQAMYLDRLMDQGQALDWGICGVGVLPADARMRDVLTAQDGLYTLVLAHPDGFLVGTFSLYRGLTSDGQDQVVFTLAGVLCLVGALIILVGWWRGTRRR